MCSQKPYRCTVWSINTRILVWTLPISAKSIGKFRRKSIDNRNPSISPVHCLIELERCFRHDRHCTVDTVSVQGIIAPAGTRTAIAPGYRMQIRIFWQCAKRMFGCFTLAEIPCTSIVWYQGYIGIVHIPSGVTDSWNYFFSPSLEQTAWVRVYSQNICHLSTRIWQKGPGGLDYK